MPKSAEESQVEACVQQVQDARALGDAKRNQALEKVLALVGSDDKFKQPLLRASMPELCSSCIKEEAVGAASKATAFAILSKLVQPKGINIMDNTPGLASATLTCLQQEDVDDDVYSSAINFLLELGKVQQLNMNKNPGLVEQLFNTPREGPLLVLDAMAKKPENALLIHGSPGFVVLTQVMAQEVEGSEVGAITLLATLAGNEALAQKLYRAPRLVDLVVGEIASDRLFADSAVQAFRFLWGLANVEQELGQRAAVIKEAVRFVTEEEPGSQVRQRALGLLRGMALYPANHDAMYAVPGIVEGLTLALRTEAFASQSHVLALQVLSLITTDTAEAVLDEALLALVLDACNRDNDDFAAEARAEAFGLLWALSEAPRLAQDGRVVDACLRAMAQEKPGSPVKRNAVGCVRGMAEENDAEARTALLAGKPALLQALVDVVRTESKASEAKVLALLALRDFTSEATLAKLPADFLSLLQACVKQETDTKVRLSALGALGKLAFVGSGDMALKIVNETGLVDYLETVLKSGVAADQVAALGVVCNLASAREPAMALAKRTGFLGLITALISDKSAVSAQAIQAVHNFSKHVAVRSALPTAAVLDKLAPLGSKGDVFATLALCNLAAASTALVNKDMVAAVVVYLQGVLDEDASSQLELSEPLSAIAELVKVDAQRDRLVQAGVGPLLNPRALDLALQWGDADAFALALAASLKTNGNVAAYVAKAEAKGWTEAAAACRNGVSAAQAPLAAPVPLAAAATSWTGGAPKSESDVGQWLRAVQLNALVDSFEREGVDGAALKSLHDHWTETNVASMFKCKAGDTLRLRAALNDLYKKA